VQALRLAAAAISASAALSSGLAGAPAPFDKGGVRIAVVNFTGGGDELQAFEADAKRQADAPGVDLRISEGRQDPDAERQLIEQAINLKVKGLIVNNGKPET
jgi:simple sugar transport system substrate-binding protein